LSLSEGQWCVIAQLAVVVLALDALVAVTGVAIVRRARTG
jgi:hypothetical protein